MNGPLIIGSFPPRTRRWSEVHHWVDWKTGERWFPRGVDQPLGDATRDVGSANELAREQAAVKRIQQAHLDHVESARRYATGLANEASFLSEEGPRETEAEVGDEDSEAAVEAATARAAAGRTLLAWKRVRELEAAGDALAFGRLTTDEWGTDYIGRMSVIDGDEVYLIDWRAPAAEPFYRATPLEPLGVSHRRHLHFTGSELTNYSDEVFDPDRIPENTSLRGEAALLEILAARSEGRMQSVVATIQAEQDAVIRASAKGPLLVQGGPGTGKTVVALHRAAYLLYADRAALAETGVLIVGPSPEFLTYISDVLPSLGESGVVSVTADRLFPGVLTDPDGSEEVAELKGSAAMADLLATAVAARRRRPKEPLTVWYGSLRVNVSVELLERFVSLADRQATHNAGSGVLRQLLVEHVSREAYEPGFGGRDDIRASLSRSPDIRLFLERHWPVLSPEQMLNDLFGSKALLARAVEAAGLDASAVDLLFRPREREKELWRRRWARSDVPLLDELLWLLGDVSEATDVETDMEHEFADEDDVFSVDEQRGDDPDIDGFEDEEKLEPEPGEPEIESYDSWREGDEEEEWV